jgi:hypothetical protein
MMADVIPLLSQSINDDSWQSVRQTLQCFRDTFPDTSLALMHDFAIFGQQCAQTVDLDGTKKYLTRTACGSGRRAFRPGSKVKRRR